MGSDNNIEESIEIGPKGPAEQFFGTQNQTLASSTVGDYWQWAYSDIVNNTNRGILAEFIVAKALGSRETVRTNWASYDVDTSRGTKVEVKSSAFLQSWEQAELSNPRFQIGKTWGWDPETGEYVDEPQRYADVYVFCLLAYREDKLQLNPLDLRQWEFYVVATSTIEAEFGNRRSATLAQVQRLSPVYSVDELPGAVVASLH